MDRTDILYQMFIKAVEDPTHLEESSRDLIDRVVDQYMDLLISQGEIPLFAVRDIIEDLRADVTEMFRKKTYGFFSLQEYRARRSI